MAKNEQEGFAFFIPMELVTTSSGTSERGHALGSSEEFLDEAVEYLRDNGVNIELIRNNSQGREQTGRQFFFSSSDWKAPWEPEGPKPNWKVGPPKNPSLN